MASGAALPENARMKITPWLVIAGLVILLDQASKQWAEAALALHQPVAVLPFFNLTLAYNEGAAFSFLAGAGGWQRWFLTAVALAVSVFLLLWLRRLRANEKIAAWGLSLVLGGALGNVIDRLLHGHVIDFLDVYYRQWHWPAFNLADSAISLGIVLLLLDSFRAERADAGGDAS